MKAKFVLIWDAESIRMHIYYKKKFGKHLQVLRKKRNYTQWKLAEIIGVDSKYLSRLESGYSSPSFDMLQKLAEALKVDIELLFRFTDMETREELEQEICKKLKSADVKELKLILKLVNDVIL